MIKKKTINKTGARITKIAFALIVCALVLFGYMYFKGFWLFEKAVAPEKIIESTEELAEEYNKYINLKESNALKANEIMDRYNEEKDADKRSNLSQEYLNHVIYMSSQLDAFDKFILANSNELKRNNVATDEVRADIKRMAVALKNNLKGIEAYGEITKQQESEFNKAIEDLDKITD